MIATGQLLEFSCPRCAAEAHERLYGPCASCRADLGRLGGPSGGDHEDDVRFEPRMHVVPNHVATKE